MFNVGDDLAIRPQWSNDVSVVRPTTGRTRGRPGESSEGADIWRASANSSVEEDDVGDLLAQSIDLGNLSLHRTPSLGDRFLRPQSTHTNLRARPSTAAMARTMPPALVHQSIELFLLSSWGDPMYIGFSGICGIDKDLEEFPLPVPETAVYVYSLDGTAPLVKLGPLDGSDNSLLVSDSRLTSSCEDMWVGQLQKGTVIGMKFHMDHSRSIKGLRIWNFNAGKEDSSMGVKHMEISIDGGRRRAVIVRKAPGNCSFDYSQFLPVGADSAPPAAGRGTPARPAYCKSNSFGEYDSPTRLLQQREKEAAAGVEAERAAKGFCARAAAAEDFLTGDLPSAHIVDDDDSSSLDSSFDARPSPGHEQSFVVEDHVCHVLQLYETPVCCGQYRNRFVYVTSDLWFR